MRSSGWSRTRTRRRSFSGWSSVRRRGVRSRAQPFAAATDLAIRAGGAPMLDAGPRRAYIDALRLDYEAAVIER
jgi:hypothetical protein